MGLGALAFIPGSATNQLYALESFLILLGPPPHMRQAEFKVSVTFWNSGSLRE